jgi:hypothetical protein
MGLSKLCRMAGMVGLVGGLGTAGCGGGGAAMPGQVGAGASGGTDSGPPVDSSIDGQLTINELMPDNVLTIKDDRGAASPWIELYNPTAQDIALGGYGITGDFTAPRKAILAASVVVPAGGYLVLWADGSAAAGPTHLGVLLSHAGGSLGLARPNGSFIDRLTYGAQETDISAAREPDGSGSWIHEWNVSPGTPNPTGAGQPLPPQAAGDPPEAVPAARDMSDRVLGYDLVPQFELQISSDDIASLRAAPDTWVQATLVYEGRSFGPVGVNLKGTSSFEPIDEKPAFRVNINKFVSGAKFFGLKEILLNNMASDPSMLRERLAYWIGRKIGGVPASRCNHSWVTLNGAPLGLYATVEEPKQQLMAYYFVDATGPVYTIHYADFQPAYLSAFELQDGTNDLSLINGATAALQMTPAETAIAAAGQFVNLHEFARYWALMVLTGHWGGWPYAPDPQPAGANAGTYADPTTHQLNFIPEGINDAFSTADFDFITQVKSVLAQKCASSPSCFQDLSAQLNEILATATRLDWAGEMQRVATQIASYVAMDSKKPYSNDDVTMYQQQVGYFMSGRAQYVTKYLVAPGATQSP